APTGVSTVFNALNYLQRRCSRILLVYTISGAVCGKLKKCSAFVGVSFDSSSG
ncbi:hypothetical protein L195_g063607, partial [Trifolium pratense]